MKRLNSNRFFWPTILVVASLAAVGGFVRYLIAANELLWLDELHTSWVVNASLTEVLQRAASGNQSPVFFWLTWPAVMAWGESELTIRLVGLIAGVATIVAVGWLVFRWTDSILGAVSAALIVAFDGQFIYYGSEARPYSLLQFLSIVQVGFFWASVSKSIETTSKLLSWANVGLVITSVLLVYVHYTVAWLFVVQAAFVVYWLMANSEFRKRFLSHALAVAAVFGVLCVPALFQMMSVFDRRANWSSVSSIDDLFFQQRVPILLWLALPVLAVVVSIVLGKQIGSDADAGSLATEDAEVSGHWVVTGSMSRFVFVFAWALVPTLTVAMLDFFEIAPLALVRYTLVGSVAMPVFAGIVVGWLEHRRIKTMLAIFLVATVLFFSPITSGEFITSGFQSEQLGQFRQENWKSPIDVINDEKSKSGHPVFLAANLIEDVEAFTSSDSAFQDYLLFPVSGLHKIQRVSSDGQSRELIACPTEPLEHFRSEDIELIKKSGGAWVIVRGTQGLAHELETEIVEKSRLISEGKGSINVNRYEVRGSVVYLLSLDW